MARSRSEMRSFVGADPVVLQRPNASLATERARVIRIELVGLAGVGKSHLARRLCAWYEGQALELDSVKPSWRQLDTLLRTIGGLAPLVFHVLRSGGSSAAVRLRFCGRFVLHEWRVAVMERSTRARRVVIDEEGRFHKLRQLRRVTRSDIALSDLPENVARMHFTADLVLLLTADPMEICARKLLRKGKPVTPETLAQQHAESGAIGQWDEYARTRRDLEQAAERYHQNFLEIEYVDDFDIDRDLGPHLKRLGLD
jgi:hypothetical protein